MNNSMTFLFTIYILSIIIHLIGLFVSATFVIPLQIKEARIKNGLAKLRIQILAAGLTIIILNIISILVLSLRFFLSGEIVRYITVLLVLSHSIGFLIFALIKRSIYHTQYSPENIELHNRIETIEKNELKDPNYYK